MELKISNGNASWLVSVSFLPEIKEFSIKLFDEEGERRYEVWESENSCWLVRRESLKENAEYVIPLRKLNSEEVRIFKAFMEVRDFKLLPELVLKLLEGELW